MSSDPSLESSRISMLSPEAARERAVAEGLPEQFAQLSVFRILLHDAPVAREVGKTLSKLLAPDSVLDPRLRELLIMRIGWVRGSVYEWTQHWRVARNLDIPEADLLAVRDWRTAPNLSEADKAVLQATDDCLEHGFIQDASWTEVCRHLATEAERVELVVAIGNWSLFAQVLRSLDVPLEAGLEGWPPDGAAPAA